MRRNSTLLDLFSDSIDIIGDTSQFETGGGDPAGGLIGDETTKTKFTVFRKLRQPTVVEGDKVRFRVAMVSWYHGRWSVTLKSTSKIVVGGGNNSRRSLYFC